MIDRRRYVPELAVGPVGEQFEALEFVAFDGNFPSQECRVLVEFVFENVYRDYRDYEMR